MPPPSSSTSQPSPAPHEPSTAPWRSPPPTANDRTVSISPALPPPPAALEIEGMVVDEEEEVSWEKGRGMIWIDSTDIRPSVPYTRTLSHTHAWHSIHIAYTGGCGCIGHHLLRPAPARAGGGVPFRTAAAGDRLFGPLLGRGEWRGELVV